MESQGLQTYSSFLHENRKELTILLLLGALAGAAYYLFSFSEPPENIPFEERGVLDLEQITVNDYQLERRSWKLKGKRAVISEKSSRMRIEQVTIWVFVSDNSSVKPTPNLPLSTNLPTQEVDLFITAEQGLIEWDDNRVTLTGNVVLLRNDGSEVHTETAIYNAKQEILTIPKPVRVLREGHTLHGSGLIYNVSKGELNLKQPVLLRHE
ncbi:MAG TPA: LPS export ABC transporter periplasmic protein LptC [Candidatus Lambdaproteobacteria bacterium]|jgi:LPS export ABC transporter protein LptC|uniref:LPS export ABC transporter periplasmic protein LptC n=2 Tax=root TaxID=1 RepID=A0A432HBB3_9DELT|nr:LPS export ABC transporter periplasmic protein LptC [SAR324 cluster bacterium]HBD29615.1 LPS export ABC transporter periplasmic protein LptC [Deltaproteobacteria bacterium]HHZ86014.1 LPS export ABC transporter periplasmic protein LptC [Candidatus Lambdaproteobacteria bacterium]RTZ79022.1 MAG: LPS export ABC transporter periplasmic protein LptC [SAR324 cluster bacterium]RTZ82431.1 MAG: LPS export ABC transporter periplasmic protein LptC [SAR324 cluster bacterium]|tara:strand:+ start:420 stop:1049 length:630 start_codon:yes stop_codon:yes gene_type:complete